VVRVGLRFEEVSILVVKIIKTLLQKKTTLLFKGSRYETR